MVPIKFRAKRKDKPTEWVYGFYAYKPLMKKDFILQEEMQPYSRETTFAEIEVNPETVGQLRYEKSRNAYYDGDVYYHAGYGMETVSDVCELQFALAAGNGEDICDIQGNIHDNHELNK